MDVMNFVDLAPLWMKTDFLRDCFLFALAAWIHSGRVKSEIRTQLGALVSIVKQDLDIQQKLLAALTSRVDDIEESLHIRPPTKETLK